MKAKLAKKCCGCRRLKPLTAFEFRYDRLRPLACHARCRDCMKPARRRHAKANYQRHQEDVKARVKANYWANPEAHRARSRAWKAKNPDMVQGQRERERERRRGRRKTAGLTPVPTS